MTTMPPEMSTAAANPSPSALTPAPVARDSLVSLQAQRSRFMINDILAAHQNGATNTTNLNIQQHQHTHQPYQQHMLQQQHQHQIALQHYIAQQQHLLQQRSQLNGSPTLPSSTSLLNQNPNTGTTTPQQQQATLTSACVATTTSQGQPAYTHAFGHLPNSTLMSFSGGPNGLHAAQAAVHYANLQYRERERSERSRLLENDERSRSPAPIQSTHSLSPAVAQRDLCNNTIHNTSGISAGGGGSSISGDQASTIDDSDSDCGAKDDDGHSVKSSDNLMGLTKKQRKARTAFTDHQLQTLEKSFERQKYLSVQDRMELANKLELSDCQVKTWYQNRRTKWKRQTAVGLELLAEAGNYAAFQRLYGGSPYLAPWPYAAAQAPPHLTGSTPIDLYYRQAAAAAVLQKPLTYRMYPSVPPLASAAALSSLPVHPPPPIPHLNASSSLTTLSNYYQTATQTLNSSNENNNFPSVSSNLRNASPNRSDDDEQRNSVEIVNRSPSPQLNPGSPPERNESPGSCPPTSSVSDNESDSENANIEV